MNLAVDFRVDFSPLLLPGKEQKVLYFSNLLSIRFYYLRTIYQNLFTLVFPVGAPGPLSK